MTVNMGARQAWKLIQRALYALGQPVVIDGLPGAESFTAVNFVDAATLVAAICAQQEAFYRALVAAKPSQVVFLAGWLARARWPNA